jgi:hypothetical protein
MKRQKRFLILGAVVLAAVCLFPKWESTFEFDGVNLRLRDCSRCRSWLFGFVLWENCSPPHEHPTAVRLRELGVLGPVREQDSQWLLIKGFTSGVRGWVGGGREYVRTLGAAFYGTPVTLPADEDLSKNLWIEWAIKDPPAAKHFWQEVQAVAIRTKRGGSYLWAAKEYLEERKLVVVGSELEAHAKSATED